MIHKKKSILVIVVLSVLSLAVTALLWDRRYISRYLTIILNTEAWSDPLYRREPLEIASGQDFLIMKRRPAACLEPLKATLSSYFDRHERLGFLVGRNGEVVFEDYADGAGPKTYLNVFGVHLGIAGLLGGVLIRDGDIESVDTPVSKFIPEWAGDSRAQITVRHLLQMSSGLEAFTDTFSPFSRALRSELSSDVLDVTVPLQSIGKPGESFYYTARNADLLAHVLERAAGMRYADALSQKLLWPAGAGSALVWPDRPNGHAQVGRSLYIRLPDLYQLAQSFVEPDQQLVPEQWIEFMTSPSKANPYFGAGVWLSLSASPERPNARNTAPQTEDSRTGDDARISFLAGFGGQRVYLIRQTNTVVIFVGRARDDWDESVIPGAVITALATCNTAQYS